MVTLGWGVVTADQRGGGSASSQERPAQSGTLGLLGGGRPGAGSGLLDRQAERSAIDGVLESVRRGFSSTLVIRGCIGLGKTALLQYAVDSAPDMRICSVTGIESEIGLEFAALHQLLIPIQAGIEDLPAPQRRALQVVFGLAEGPAPDLFLVGLAALTLLARAAEEQPVLCLIDDGHWLDAESARALPFVARRLYADRVGMVVAISEPAPVHTFEQLPALRLAGLPRAEAVQLLQSVAGTPVDERVVNRILTDTERNPLALTEIGSEFSADELAGRAALPRPLPVGRRVADRVVRELADLDPDTQAFLVLAAANVGGGRAALWRASHAAGIDADAAAAVAESARLIELSAECVRFRHPVIRSAVYHSAADSDRKRAHLELSAAMNSSQPDLRAWHQGAAATEPDECVAAALESAAWRAHERGGLGAAAALLRRSIELSEDDGRRAGRELMLAGASLKTGHPDEAHDLAEGALSRLPDPEAQAQGERLRGEILFAQGQAGESATVLEGFARRLGPAQPGAREALAAAMRASLWAGADQTRKLAAAALAFPRPDESEASVADLLLEGFAARYTTGYAASIAPLRAALSRLRSEDLKPMTALQWSGLGTFAAGSVWDDTLPDVAGAWLRTARAEGALTLVPAALALRAVGDCLTGRLADARVRLAEMQEIIAVGGTRPVPGVDGLSEGLVLLYTGRVAEAREAASARIQESIGLGDGGIADISRAIAAIADVWTGDYDRAFDMAVTVVENDVPFVTELILPELVEAAWRSDRRREATAAFDELSERTLAVGTPVALGKRSACAALLSASDHAERAYQEAISHLERSRNAFELARAHLRHGQWLRRARRRRDARRELTAAYDMFDRMGAEGFATLAATELSASGERARARTPATTFDLTPQETRVAGLAAEGETNNQIAAELFISPRTVEYHLSKVFRKLGVTSRAQLASLLVSLRPAPG
ncbi:MAG TPA: LuxR C-terminal-related transcriptional regulator [Streptosporangiaceae bacterium]|nr:LuxR C-terminal-related transcriptional regulator [Streptosporangiaceae bacterium]